MIDFSSIALSAATKAMLEERNYIEFTDRLHLGMNEDGSKFVGRLHSAYSMFGSGAANLWCQHTPGSSRVKKKMSPGGDWWTFQPSDFTALRLAYTWDDSQISFADDFTAVTFANILTRFIAGEANASRVNAWHEHKAGVQLPIDVKAEFPLNTYQSVAAMNAIASTGFAFFMEQGTGKTYPTIVQLAYAAKKAQARGEFFRALVVCPNNVRLNWIREIEKFSPVPLRAMIIAGDQATRIQRVGELFVTTPKTHKVAGAIAVASYAAASELCFIFQHLKITLDVGVLDESHTIKNPGAQITKDLLAARPCFKKRLALTGTPIGNTAFDLWAQLEWLYPGCSGFLEFGLFKRYYSKNVPPQASAAERLQALQNMPLLRERLARNAFVVSKAAALPHLPDKVFDIVSVKMTKTQAALYDKLAIELAAQIEKDLEQAERADGRTRATIINNVLTKSLKLTQVTSGFMKWDPVVDPMTDVVLQEAFEEPIAGPNPKIDWLIEEIQQAPKDEKFIVWSYQTFAQDLILEALKKAGIGAVRCNGDTPDVKRNEYIDLFNDERLKIEPNAYDPLESPTRVFVGNPKAMGAGSNLLGYPIGRPDLSPCNACRVVRYAFNYSHIDRAQSDDRSHRVGTRVPIRYTTLMCSGTIERKIWHTLEDKRTNAMDMTEVRDILRELARKGEDD